MDHDMFEEMVDRPTPRIQKQDTNMRRALEPGLKLISYYTQIFGYMWLLCVIGIWIQSSSHPLCSLFKGIDLYKLLDQEKA